MVEETPALLPAAKYKKWLTMADIKRYLCPECGRAVVKAGKVVINRSGRRKQQWKCGGCGRRTLKPLRKEIDPNEFAQASSAVPT